MCEARSQPFGWPNISLLHYKSNEIINLMMLNARRSELAERGKFCWKRESESIRDDLKSRLVSRYGSWFDISRFNVNCWGSFTISFWRFYMSTNIIDFIFKLSLSLWIPVTISTAPCPIKAILHHFTKLYVCFLSAASPSLKIHEANTLTQKGDQEIKSKTNSCFFHSFTWAFNSVGCARDIICSTPS